MTALLLAAALAAAPGCPAALARAGTLPDPGLAAGAAALFEALEAGGAGGPAEALREEAAAAAGAPDRAAAGARFRAALSRHCALASQAAFPAPGLGDRARAAEILDRPAFRRARADPEAIRLWLLGLWQRVLGLLETGQAQRYAAFSRAVFLAAAAAAALIGLLALRRRAPGPGRRPAPPEARLPAPDARLDGAEEAAARGDAGRAVRLSLLAALASLERTGTVPPGRALTNRELVEELRGGDPAQLDAFRRLSRLFDRTVYGGVPAGAAEADEALRAARALGAEGHA